MSNLIRTRAFATIAILLLPFGAAIGCQGEGADSGRRSGEGSGGNTGCVASDASHTGCRLECFCSSKYPEIPIISTDTSGECHTYCSDREAAAQAELDAEASDRVGGGLLCPSGNVSPTQCRWECFCSSQYPEIPIVSTIDGGECANYCSVREAAAQAKLDAKANEGSGGGENTMGGANMGGAENPNDESTGGAPDGVEECAVIDQVTVLDVYPLQNENPQVCAQVIPPSLQGACTVLDSFTGPCRINLKCVLSGGDEGLSANLLGTLTDRGTGYAFGVLSGEVIGSASASCQYDAVVTW